MNFQKIKKKFTGFWDDLEGVGYIKNPLTIRVNIPKSRNVSKQEETLYEAIFCMDLKYDCNL